MGEYVWDETSSRVLSLGEKVRRRDSGMRGEVVDVVTGGCLILWDDCSCYEYSWRDCWLYIVPEAA